MDSMLRRPWKGLGASYARPASSGRSQVCQACFDWTLHFPPKERQSYRRGLNFDFYDIAASAELEECRYCYAIYQCLMAFGAKIRLNASLIVTLTATLNKPFHLSWDDEERGRLTLEVYSDDEANECALDGLGSARDIQGDANAPQVLEQARNWLKNCQENHPACKLVDGPFPRRLIFVGDNTVDYKLVEGVHPDTPYVALSHCWGMQQAFTTTRSNLDQRTAGIKQTDLPATFQDAITVTQGLGLQYIWIDSLCIVQDDESDWNHESGRMGGIYERSCCTIAASTASGDQAGFLGTTSQRLFYVSQNVDMFPFSEASYVKARMVHDIRQPVILDPLLHRGWTFQERLLPRRLLTYSSALTWECRATSEYAHRKLNWFLEADRTGFLNLVNQPDPSLRDFYDFWYYGIVQPYSRRILTKDSDQIPALSALARKFHEKVPHDTYLAGIWKEDIPTGLCWKVELDSHERVRSRFRAYDGYRVPSWSWASIEAPITFRAGRSLAVSVLDAQCQSEMAVNSDPYGHVRDGSMRLKGRVARARLSFPMGGGPMISFLLPGINAPLVHLPVYLDTPVRYQRVTNDYLQALELASPDLEVIARSHSSMQSKHLAGEVICLLMYNTFRDGDPKRFFLVLSPSPRQKGAFERIGAVDLTISREPLGVDLWLQEFSEREIIII
ncbi:HET domain-containing [Fusarium albosuccineum]|uniref:HET domain-containing n=1 Tax=Fusarium albosuccineum TaxID=1237068 RepID=A0A8H4LBP5_9HYPO|nr:HET domain-containing [Fusarium albosuccineum]